MYICVYMSRCVWKIIIKIFPKIKKVLKYLPVEHDKPKNKYYFTFLYQLHDS